MRYNTSNCCKVSICLVNVNYLIVVMYYFSIYTTTVNAFSLTLDLLFCDLFDILVILTFQ